MGWCGAAGPKDRKRGGNAIPPSEGPHGLPGGTSGIKFIGTGTVVV